MEGKISKLLKTSSHDKKTGDPPAIIIDTQEKPCYSHLTSLTSAQPRKDENDKSLDYLNTNLQRIRDEGFNKLSRLIRDLHVEKQSYKQKVYEVENILDDRVATIKSDIDGIHLEMKERLTDIKHKMSKKISSEIETCRKHVRDMNKLVQTGIEAFDSINHDYQYLFQLNMEILEKLNYMKSLNNSIHVHPPVFTGSSYKKEYLKRIIGKLSLELNGNETHDVPNSEKYTDTKMKYVPSRSKCTEKLFHKNFQMKMEPVASKHTRDWHLNEDLEQK